MARLLLGVSGGIAAYKALEAARLATLRGHAVRVIQTESSTRFVGRASFEAITGAPVLIDEFERDPMRGAYPGEPPAERAPISHLALVQRADVYLIAPASANTLAKLATGQANNLLCAAALAACCPVVVAPAMNSRMYEHPATRANIELLASRGLTVVAPGEGELASYGEHGIGRLAEPEALLAACEGLLADAGRAGGRRWTGLRVLVTAGGTREPIDSVRFIGNRSSGRMGFALAAEAVRRGGEVTLIAANTGALEPPAGAELVRVQTAAELARACQRPFDACDVLVMAAAVADFRPAAPLAEKIDKSLGPPPPIELEPTEDVLCGLAARRRPGQVLVGFAAEHGDRAVARGLQKLERKGLDLVVVNDVSKPGVGFESAHNEVTILAADGANRHVPQAGKDQVACAILDEVDRIRASMVNRDGAGGAGARSPARV